MFKYIFEYLVKNNRIDLLFFLTEEQLNQKEELVKN
jgi:hypothetical protein